MRLGASGTEGCPLFTPGQVLKRKKMYEQQRDQLAAQSFNVEQVGCLASTGRDFCLWA
jgi:hypothetical protein